MDAVLLVVAAYLCGSLPTGVWAGRLAGVDPRRGGSGNIGATNVARTAGLGPALITLLGDIAKGAIPAMVGCALTSDPWLAAGIGAAAVVGHIYSVFLGFSGGKGVATAFGVFLILAPMATAVSALAFTAVLFLTRYVSVASMLAAALLPVVAALLGSPLPTVVASGVLGSVIILCHRDNLSRLCRGDEPRIGSPRH